MQSKPTPDASSVYTTVAPHDQDSQPLTALPETLTGGIAQPGMVEPLVASPTRIGDYNIIRKLGEGGMGSVFLAEDVRLKRKVAIKTMKADLASHHDSRERFLREARAAAVVEHDNIVPIWQVGEDAGQPFIVMPFLHGEMLADLLKREPVCPIGLLLKVARDVTEALAAAHEVGLIHRDIKPGNVWLEGDPKALEASQQVRRCKILDFGLARSAATEDVQLTATGTILGTPAFMAPEQARGEHVDPRADLFSLGAMLYCMATGKLPFDGRSTMAVLTALATVDPPPACHLRPSLPEAMSKLIERMLSKDPARRPQSAAEVVVAIKQIVNGMQAKKSASADKRVSIAGNKDGQMIAELTPKGAPAAKKRHGRMLLLAALALAALIPLGWWLATTVLRVETENGTLVVGKDVKQESAKADERKMVERALSLGGRVQVEGDFREIKVLADLPTEAFRLTYLNLSGVKVSDADLACFQGCKHLTDLWLQSTQVGDAGLAHFKDCKNLTYLDLRQTQVSDAGLAHFKDCENLTCLNLQGTQVSDAGLAHLAGCKNLAELDLSGTKVSDAGLARLADYKSLIGLGLTATKVSDAGAAHLAGCRNLETLYLDGTQLSDAGLALLAGHNRLTRLNFSHTQVSDVGLAHFEGRTNLKLLNLAGMKVSDVGLANFKGCHSLEELHLSQTKVTDAGLARFKGCKTLMHLYLRETEATDAGIVHFADCKNLRSLDLWGTQVSDAGLAHFKDCMNLTHVFLTGTKVTSKGVDQLKAALPDCRIEWDREVTEPKK